jgi:hypothetical protein
MSITAYLPLYSALFVSRHDDYAMQTATGRYKRVGKPLTHADLYDHLIGRRTYGTYVIDETGNCRFAVIDADTESGDLLARLWVIQDELATQGIVSYLERSRRGGHLWIFFTRPVPAAWVRAWLLPFCPSDFEFYPKQDVRERYGSLIRLPLGVHRKSGQRYPFIERCAGGLHTLTRTDEERLTWFTSIQRMEVPQQEKVQTVPPHTPSLSLPPSHYVARGPSPIRQWNAAQDPFAVIGRYVDLKSNGVGTCPFGKHHSGGEDTAPSFKVYTPKEPGGYCWYCYTWQKGGSVFDFLRYYHDLDASTLWQRIQEEGMVV